MCSPPRGGTRIDRPLSVELATPSDFARMLRESSIRVEQWQIMKRQHMLNSVIPHVKVTQIKRVSCPAHLYQLKNSLAEIKPSETLRVITNSIAVRNDLTAACQILGHKVRQINTDSETSKDLYITRSH